MAKKSKGKVIQMLSPENYIRQKARTLPLYECRVNVGWEDGHLATVIVARKHTNGNITAGIYLVDLDCLGVKDTFWYFNIPLSEYKKEIKQLMELDEGLEKIDYVLAHNIVYAGISFAGEYEFKPHKHFNSVTQFILEEDTQDVPLIEIECGMDGLPSYMQGPLENDARARQVVAQLERVAGRGKYYLINEEGEILNQEDIEKENDDADDPFDKMSVEDKKIEFETYFKRADQLSEDEKNYFFDLSQSLIDDLLDLDAYNEFLKTIEDELSDIPVNIEEISDEMLGIDPGGTKLPDKIKELFLQMLENAEDSRKINKMLPRFRKYPGTGAAAEYIELLAERHNNSEKIEELLQAAVKKYPRYGLLQMLLSEVQITSFDPANPQLDTRIPHLYGDFFPGRDSVHPWEFFGYLNLRTLFILREKNLEMTEAWKNVVYNFQPKGNIMSRIENMILLFEIALLANRFEIKK